MNHAGSRTSALSQAGVSIWLDDLSRERLLSGGIETLIADRDVVGITTNPSIFGNALSTGSAYDSQLAELRARDLAPVDAILELTTGDVARACDMFLPVFEATNGVDGRVSIEVSPDLAHDAEGSLEQTELLRAKVDRPNVLVKIPATVEGLSAITEATARGISINVTLIFSLERYSRVIDAYLTGLERAYDSGLDLRPIQSVASFFVSRVDTEVDRRLDAIGTSRAMALKSRAGIANARLVYQVFERAFATERARTLIARGANPQRPLWASTGVKNPALPDTIYVVELVAPGVVNTMPEKTLEAVADHAVVRGNTIVDTYDVSQRVLDALEEAGISYDDVTATLEREGIEKFSADWRQLIERVSVALGPARA